MVVYLRFRDHAIIVGRGGLPALLTFASLTFRPLPTRKAVAARSPGRVPELL